MLSEVDGFSGKRKEGGGGGGEGLRQPLTITNEALAE